MSVVDYTLLTMIIKLCEGHAIFQKMMSYPINQMADIIGFEPICDCVYIDRED